MSTNKIVLRSVDEFLMGYKPTYIPIMPLFMGKSTAYTVEEGSINFNRLEAVGDLRSKLHGAKDTTIHMITAREGKKTFKKYFLGSKYIQSQLQDQKGYEDVVAQVLDEHNKQSDGLLADGGGTQPSDVINNGLIYSQDANYVLKTSYEVQKDAAGDHLADFYQKIVSIVQEADDVDGRKVVFLYGDSVIAKYNSLFVENKASFAKALSDALPQVTFVKVPKAITPANSNGFIVVNMDQVHMHYTLLPTVKAQGINEEMMYAWTNFLMGSVMLEVLVSGGIVRQPVTFAA